MLSKDICCSDCRDQTILALKVTYEKADNEVMKNLVEGVLNDIIISKSNLS